MSTRYPSRRNLVTAAGLGLLAPLLPRRAAAATSLVAAIYPGAWEEAYGKVVKPAVKTQHDIDLSFATLFAVDQVAKAAASRGNPPFDVFVLDPGPRMVAIERGVVAPFDAARLKNRELVPPLFVDQWGVGVSAQLVGFGYNPKKIDPPKNWLDLLSPKYHGKVALTGFQTTFGTLSLMELNKALGGSVENVEPLFKAIKEFLPHAGAVTAPASLMSLFQQGQVEVLYTTYAEIATLRSRGVDIAFAKPETGLPMFYNTLLVAKGAQEPDAAYRYIDTVISREVQTQLQAKPWNFLSVNSTVELKNDFPPEVIASHDDLKNMVTYDWGAINKSRPQWIERFNKEVAS
jgi:putative spermidine/putrescine transport system substrate-binding protein